MDFTDKQTDRIKLPLIINDNECRADLGNFKTVQKFEILLFIVLKF